MSVDTDSSEIKKTIAPHKAGWIIALMSVISPVMFLLHPIVTDMLPHFTISAQTWQIDYFHGYIYLDYLNFYIMMTMAPFLAIRYVLAYQTIRLYRGETTVKSAKIIAILSDIPFICLSLLITLPSIVALILTGFYTSFFIPTPFPLLTFLLLLRFRPPEEIRKFLGKESEDQQWWTEKTSTTT